MFYKIKNKEDVNICDLTVHDLNKEDDSVFKLFEDSFLSCLCVKRTNFTSVKEAIGDLPVLQGTETITDNLVQYNFLFDIYLKQIYQNTLNT